MVRMWILWSMWVTPILMVWAAKMICNGTWSGAKSIQPRSPNCSGWNRQIWYHSGCWRKQGGSDQQGAFFSNTTLISCKGTAIRHNVSLWDLDADHVLHLCIFRIHVTAKNRCMRFAPFLGIASMATTTTMQILVQLPCLPSQEVGTVRKLKVSVSFPKIQVL